MIANIKNYLIAAGVLILLLLFSFIGGCQHGKKVKVCPTIVTGTTLKIDTVTHYVYNIWPWYIQGEKEVIYQPVPQDVDTNAILAEYFAKHIFPRQWENDTLLVNISDTISQNKPIGNRFSYKIKTPFTTTINTIDNSISYSKFLYFGTSIPIKPISNINYISLDLFYAFPKGYLGAMWQPEIKTFSAKLGVKLLQFKK